MSLKEIPRAEWRDFFNNFSRQHEGWLATLEVFGPEIGAQEEAHELPFEGVSVDEDSEHAAIEISLGAFEKDHVTHKIEQPAHVWLEQADGRASAALEIESGDDSKTLLRFNSSGPSEDGDH
jgi:hypothetical protein